MITVRLARPGDLQTVQDILNHRDNATFLGGMTMMDTLKAKLKGHHSLWLAEWDGAPVGAAMVSGRPQAHLLKYGEIAVLPAFRRRRVATALYCAMTAQGVIEGRRLFEDTIVGDNPTQFYVLPSLGLRHAGELRHRTASAKSIHLFQLSLLDERAYEGMEARVPAGTTIEVLGGLYASDLWAKNLDIFKKHSPEFAPAISALRQRLLGQLRVLQDAP